MAGGKAVPRKSIRWWREELDRRAAFRMAEGETAAPQRDGAAALAAAVFAIAEQWAATRRKLAADLVKPSGVQPHAYQRGRRAVYCSGFQNGILQQSLFYTAPE